MRKAGGLAWSLSGKGEGEAAHLPIRPTQRRKHRLTSQLNRLTLQPCRRGLECIEMKMKTDNVCIYVCLYYLLPMQ